MAQSDVQHPGGKATRGDDRLYVSWTHELLLGPWKLRSAACTGLAVASEPRLL
jgi:hypothetical protein